MAETVEATDPSGDTAALLWLAPAGDQVAFERLYQRYGALLYTVALRVTGSSQLATEAVHTTLIQIWRNTIHFDPHGATPESWLLAVVRSHAIAIMRWRQRSGLGLDSSARTIDPDADMARLAHSPDPAARRLHTALGGLDRDGRLLLIMGYLDGMSHAEIAQRMRLPIGTVKAWIRRSLEMLRNGLEAQR